MQQQHQHPSRAGGASKQPAPATSSRPFHECLALATQLGLGSDSTACSTSGSNVTSGFDQVGEFMAAARQRAALQVQHHALESTSRACGVTDPERMAQRAQDLEEAAKVLLRALEVKENLVRRTSDSQLTPHLTIDTRHQQQFLHLLQRSAGDSRILQESLSHIDWARTFADPPSCWDGVLQPLSDAGVACCEYKAPLEQAHRALCALDGAATN